MKIITTGSLGHIRKPLAKGLIREGHAVTVVSSNRSNKKILKSQRNSSYRFS